MSAGGAWRSRTFDHSRRRVAPAPEPRWPALAQISNGDAITFNVTAASTLEHIITVYGTTRRTGTTITATSGAASELNTVEAVTATTNEDWVYTLSFTPDSIGDIVTISIGSSGVSTAATNTSNSFRFGAAAVSVVPEPGAFALAGVGAMCVMLRCTGTRCGARHATWRLAVSRCRGGTADRTSWS